MDRRTREEGYVLKEGFWKTDETIWNVSEDITIFFILRKVVCLFVCVITHLYEWGSPIRRSLQPLPSHSVLFFFPSPLPVSLFLTLYFYAVSLSYCLFLWCFFFFSLFIFSSLNLISISLSLSLSHTHTHAHTHPLSKGQLNRVQKIHKSWLHQGPSPSPSHFFHSEIGNVKLFIQMVLVGTLKALFGALRF